MKKAKYRIRNWADYNQALVDRGSLTFWFDEEARDSWIEQQRTGRRGAPRTYSGVAIQCVLTLRVMFRLPFRASEGMVRSLLELMDLAQPTPDYTTLCRRQRELAVTLPRTFPSKPVHVVIDATGLKVYGEGEWHVRQHGSSKRRTWRKLHLAVDEANHEVLAAALTSNEVGDSTMFADLLDAIEEPIDQVCADGAYDSWDNHARLQQRGVGAAFHRARRLGLVNMAAVTRTPCLGMKLCGRFAKAVARPENAPWVTIVAASPRRPCFVSSGSLARISQPIFSSIRRQRPFCAVVL